MVQRQCCVFHEKSSLSQENEMAFNLTAAIRRCKVINVGYVMPTANIQTTGSRAVIAPFPVVCIELKNLDFNNYPTGDLTIHDFCSGFWRFFQMISSQA